MSDFILDDAPSVRVTRGEDIRFLKYESKISPHVVWLVAANVEEAAEHIFMCDFVKRGSHEFAGYGGATLTFKLVDGEEISLPGPWHSNADSLFTHTGVDVRDKHLTFVVIASGRKLMNPPVDYRTLYTEVLYKDDLPVLGQFNRGELIAQGLANALERTVYCYSKSWGGSSDGPVVPVKKGANPNLGLPPSLLDDRLSPEQSSIVRY